MVTGKNEFKDSGGRKGTMMRSIRLGVVFFSLFLSGFILPAQEEGETPEGRRALPRERRENDFEVKKCMEKIP